MCPTNGKVTYLMVLIIGLFQTIRSETYDQNEYVKMPKLFTLDDYRDCMLNGGGLYCITDIQLKASKPSELWHIITNFSSNTLKHYRHDILHKGICVMSRCNVSEERLPKLSHDPETLTTILTECMTDELEKMYNFEGNATIKYCNYKNQKKELNNNDWFYIIIIFGILIVNVIGTAYHIKIGNTDQKNPNRYLMAVSTIANWNKIMSKRAIDSNQEEKGKTSLSSIQGLRFLTMFCVIFAHVILLISFSYVDNTERIEFPYEDPLMHLIYNGSLVVQTFFIMGSFLMSYNFLIFVEKQKTVNFWSYFYIIIQRWLRLTPVYAIVIGFITTLYDKTGSGPLWHLLVGDDAEACRNWWWTNLLYINNYVGQGPVCLAVSWYLATDTQLFCYGVLVMMIISKYPSIKRLFLSLVMVISLLIPGILTYKNNYYPTVPQAPESFRTFYQTDPTFKYIYTAIPGNIVCYTLGLICGIVHYHLEKKEIKLAEKRWYRIIHITLFPLGLLVVLSGALFYADDYVYNPLTAAVYASLYKAAFGILVVLLILGVFHKCNEFINRMVEWEGYQIAGKLTYCAYLIHTLPQRILLGIAKHPYDILEYNIIIMFIASITLTYFVALIICVLIEVPFTNIQKLIFEMKKSKKPPITDDRVTNTNNNDDEKVSKGNCSVQQETSHIKANADETVKSEVIEVDVEINNKCSNCSKL